MAYVFITSECFGCGRIFSYHPNKVPSVVYNGSREPICQACVEWANPLRAANGLEPIVIRPGAYDVADEREIDWED